MTSTLNQQFRMMRVANQLTQDEAAARAGLSRMTVSNIEKARLDPRLSTLQELARALGLELMLVPSELQTELTNFIQSNGRYLAYPPGLEAPKSRVDQLTSATAARTPQQAKPE